METFEHRCGRIAYEAYRAASGGKSLVSGQNIPEFGGLPDAIRDAWIAAGMAVADDLRYSGASAKPAE